MSHKLHRRTRLQDADDHFSVILFPCAFTSCACLHTVAIDVETGRTKRAFLEVPPTPSTSSTSSSTSATTSLTTSEIKLDEEISRGVVIECF